jgi:PleD family two-component response regulator
VLPNAAVKDANDLIAFADQALYKSKNAGRNRVTLYQAAQ